ncbi:MAG: hypothetical protein JSW07_17840 [bacterium]|nr:MAG: hypothetical protein JSW07_17840 [bacterium]
MENDLNEKLEGLESKVKDLSVQYTGETSKQLLEAQDKLAKLTLAAIVQELNKEHEAYKEAILGLNKAIDFISDADKKIEGITEVIKLTAKAIDLVEKALKNA